MPPPWKTFAVNGYGASTSSTNPRACIARESDLDEAGEARDQEPPGDPGRARRVGVVGPGARREVRAQAHVSAVVDLLVGDQRLRQLHPDRPLHRRRRAVHRVVAPRRGAVVVELEHPVARHPQLGRRVHHRVDARVRGQLLLGRERHLGERDRAVAAGDGQLHQPRAERASPLLEHLADEALVGVDPLRQDHALDRLAGHVAAGHAGALVERPVHRRAGPADPELDMVGEQPVVRADLARRNVDPVLVAADRARPGPTPASSRRCRSRG